MKFLIFACMVLLVSAGNTTCFECAKEQGKCFDQSIGSCWDNPTYNKDCVSNLKYSLSSFNATYTCNTKTSDSLTFYKGGTPITQKVEGNYRQFFTLNFYPYTQGISLSSLTSAIGSLGNTLLALNKTIPDIINNAKDYKAKFTFGDNMRIYSIPAIPPILYTNVEFSSYVKLETDKWVTYKEYDGMYLGYHIVVWNLDKDEQSFTFQADAAITLKAILSAMVLTFGLVF